MYDTVKTCTNTGLDLSSEFSLGREEIPVIREIYKGSDSSKPVFSTMMTSV